MIVVDTNILIYFYLSSEHTARAEALFQHDPDWRAPWLWRSEFRNVLAGYLRRGTLTLDRVLALQNEAENLMTGAEYHVPSDVVLRLVQDSNCSAYDCEFVALAQGLRTRLVTLDQKVLAAFPTLAISLGVMTEPPARA